MSGAIWLGQYKSIFLALAAEFIKHRSPMSLCKTIEFKYDTWSFEPESWEKIVRDFGGVVDEPGPTGRIKFEYCVYDPHTLISGNNREFHITNKKRSSDLWKIMRASGETFTLSHSRTYQFLVRGDFSGHFVYFETDK